MSSATQPGWKPRLRPFPLPNHAWCPRPTLGAGKERQPCVAVPLLPDLLPGTPPLNSGVMTALEPLIWVLLPYAQALGHLSPVFLR